MNALITGANGFLGAHLARRLVERGFLVRCLVRKGNADALAGLAVTLHEGDVTEPSTLALAMRGVDVVYHLAGVRRTPSREDFLRVNAEGTRHVGEALAAQGPRPDGSRRRLVLCGSLAASGPSSPERPRREEDPFNPQEWYGESKALAERIAFGFGDRLAVTALRPCRILGPGDRENLVFFKLIKKGVRLRLGGPRRPLSMVDVDDVVELLVLLAERDEAVGEAFFSAGAQTATLEELQDEIARILGVKTRTLYLPKPVLLGLSQAADVASKLTGKHLPLNRKLARQLLAPAWTCSTEKAERVLGFRPRVPLAESLQRSADWYRQKGLI